MTTLANIQHFSPTKLPFSPVFQLYHVASAPIPFSPTKRSIFVPVVRVFLRPNCPAPHKIWQLLSPLLLDLKQETKFWINS